MRTDMPNASATLYFQEVVVFDLASRENHDTLDRSLHDGILVTGCVSTMRTTVNHPNPAGAENALHGVRQRVQAQGCQGQAYRI
jgi:hypothetical protein